MTEETENVNWLNSEQFEPENPPPKKHWGWLFFIILIVVFLSSCGVRKLTLAAWPNDPGSYDPLTLKPKNIGFLASVKNFVFHSDNILKGQEDDRVNILLLGMGGPGHDGPYLTDTNIVLSIQPSTNQIAMISVPRDLGVELDGYGLRKINSANAFGEVKNAGQGGEYAREIFAKTFNLDIPYYVRVDFKAFMELIDAVGGVTIDVPRAFTDSAFPGPNYSYQTISFKAGRQNLTGETALQYARSRHGNNGEGSDFARARRQQQVLTALKEKLLSFGTYTNPVKVRNILESLTTHVATNLDFGQLMYLANLAKNINGEIKMLVLDNQTDGYLESYIAPNGAFVLKPKTSNFEQINLAMQNVFSESISAIAPTAPAENKPIFSTAKIEVQNGTWRVGLAAKTAARLQDTGFTTLPASNASSRPLTETTIYVKNVKIDKEIITALNKIIAGPVKTKLPDWMTTTDNTASSSLPYNPEADIIVVLGEDFDE
ncbi:MAG: hypothetical protein A3J93_03250 [Candidatus Magasanikbacteria bacterium RIFOXYC2_FULL_42_28]|uniref:Cell envelope-related transcriptional attenuator domain-containing protein n=1 Tax=Candidatus Magasanikbacteria bacterium RIFOXYC2_FULL_42_28 TaxID=1798704 RepID=A0A1F6NUN0_9BACT|nr:MAG: hypothetical protein A3J93_03250 [Candidatus Magasanikbacteria bacterium RIFOXYC2_FULL_42_28]